MSKQKKLILVIGATGTQGIAVIDALLAPAADGSPSPYVVRGLTRDPESRRSTLLADKGVELVKGAFDDLQSVATALEGCYGAYVNTDGFTVGEVKENFLGMRIFELAKQTKNLRQYVWSSLENIFRETGYDPRYYVEHLTGKGRVGDWLQQQPSDTTDTGMSWSMISTGPYMDMLGSAMFGPLKRRQDGTFVFATPLDRGRVPMIALADIGYFARYTFDNRTASSRVDYRIASDLVSWDYLARTFTKVTGQKAEVIYQTYDDWDANFTNTDRPVANEREKGDGSTTAKDNFRRWWDLYRDDVIKKDLDALRRIHPGLRSLEMWMLETGYTGEVKLDLLKNSEDGKSYGLNHERVAQL